MESLGEILAKRGAPAATSKEGTEASFVGRGPEEASSVGNGQEEASSCPHCRGAGYVYRRQADGRPDYAHAVPCRCHRQRMGEGRLERLRLYSNLGALTSWTFDRLVPQGKSTDPANQERFLRAYQAALAFAEKPEGWLVFLGPSSSGKTHLAAAIANRRLADGHLVILQRTSDLLDHLRATFSPESSVSYDQLFLQLKETPLLILDDLGLRAQTAWAEDKLTQLIEHRFVNRLPTVINIDEGSSLGDLKDKWRSRLTDPSLAHVYQLETRQPYPPDPDPALLRSMTFDTFDYKRVNLPLEQRQNLESVYRLARDYAERPSGWLVLQGENGCGKTHLAAAIRNHQTANGHPASFVSFVFVPDFLDHLRSTFGPDSKVSYDDAFERVKNAPLLVLDDYGQHAASEWAQEKLYLLINHRYMHRLPMVVTMCSSLDEIETRVSSRLADSQISIVFAIMAPDYRTDRAAPGAPPPPRSPQRRSRGRTPTDGGRG